MKRLLKILNINPSISLSMCLFSRHSSPCGVISSNSTSIAFFISSTVRHGFIHRLSQSET